MAKKRMPKNIPIDLVAGVPLDLLRRLDCGEPVTEPMRNLLVVAYSASAGGQLVELGRAEGFAAALRRMIDSMGLEGGDPAAYFGIAPELVDGIKSIRSAADREFLLLFASSFSVCLPGDFEDDEYLTETEVTFPDYAPVIGWSATGPMIDVAYAILERREVATSRAAIQDQRLARRAAQLESHKQDERIDAIHFLSRMAGEGAVRLLSGALRDRRFEVRVAAGEALAFMASDASFDALIAALDDQPDDGAQAGIVRAGSAILPRLESHVAEHGPAIARCVGQIAERNGKLDERSRTMVLAIAAQPGWRSHEAVIPVLADPMLPHLASARPILERYTTSRSPTVRRLATKWLRLFNERDG